MTQTVLWLVGEPGVGKTTLARRLLAEVGRPSYEWARPKWTEFSALDGDGRPGPLTAAAVGTWKGDTFDGGDTVPPGDIKPALAFYSENYAPGGSRAVPLVLFDGDKFASANAVGAIVLVHDVEAVCLHLVGEDDAAAGRLARGSHQNESWIRGRRTKSARFAEAFPGRVVTLTREDITGIASAFAA